MEHFSKQLMPRYSDIAESIEEAFIADAPLFYCKDKQPVAPRIYAAHYGYDEFKPIH